MFIESPHLAYIQRAEAAANTENLRQTFEGFQSVPRSFGGNKGFEIRMWNVNETWHTPWFHKNQEESYYEEDTFYNLVLDVPDDIQEQVGIGSLVIQLEVDTREEEGWEEEVVYWI